MSRTFEVGDRVRYVDAGMPRYLIGQTGVIVRKENFASSFAYWVIMDENTDEYEAGCEMWALGIDIQHVEG